MMADSDVPITQTELVKHEKWEPLSDPPPGLRSLFAIRKYPGDSTVFPPGNHENLYISTDSVENSHSQSSSPPFPSSPSLSSFSSSSFSPNDESPYSTDSNVVDLHKSVPDCPAKAAGYGQKWWNLGLQVLFSRVNGVILFRRCFTSARWAVTSILSPRGLAAILVVSAYFRWQRRLINRQSEEQLRRTIREKDERINKLLSQIAEMNQVLLAMHKGTISRN